MTPHFVLSYSSEGYITLLKHSGVKNFVQLLMNLGRGITIGFGVGFNVRR
jgi:uncharacterized membrane protein (Fun14 family)